MSAAGKSVIPPMIEGTGRVCVKLELACQGRDLVLLLTGGEAHVGAMAVWDARWPTEPAQVTELANHKEGPLAGTCAEIVGRATGRTVVAVVGIHQDGATRGEIEAIVLNAEKAAREAAKEFLRRNGMTNAE